jgi:hypothetical protein
MTDVHEPWDAAVDVADLRDADFQSRTENVAVRFTDDVAGYVRGLADRWRLNESTVIDRCLRLYLGHLFDTDTHPYDRDHYGVRRLVPPEGWVTGFERYSEVLDTETMVVNASTPSAVVEMLDDGVEAGCGENRSELVRDAVRWVVGAA